MDDIRKQELRERIEADIEQCRTSIRKLEDSSRPVAPDKALGRLTRMESLSDQGISSAGLNRARERLDQLERALEKIEQPGFGLCNHCGQPIPAERLMAMPESTHCVQCAGRRI